MAEEIVAPEATPDKEVNGDAKPKRNNNHAKRDETPIEELFDLSKPIPKVRHQITVQPVPRSRREKCALVHTLDSGGCLDDVHFFHVFHLFAIRCNKYKIAVFCFN